MTLGDLELTVVQDAHGGRGYVAGFAVTDQLIVAAGGQPNRGPMMMASSNARDFEPRPTPRDQGLRDVLAVGDCLWTCGEVGQLAVSRDHGATWTSLDTGTNGCLHALALAGDGAVWVVGDQGFAARVRGDQVEPLDLGTTARLSAVYAVRDEIVVLGFDGRMRSLARWHRHAMSRPARRGR